MPVRDVLIANDDIEIVCDLLWFVRDEWSPDMERLWDRLQPIRHGDYGGTASTDRRLGGRLVHGEVSPGAARCVVACG